MSVVQIKWDDAALVQGLKRMRERRGSFKPVFDELKKPFRDDLRAYAAQQAGPDGRWEPRKASTTERYQHRFSQRRGLRGGKSGPIQRKLIRRKSKKLLGKLPSAVTFKTFKGRGGSSGSIQAVSKVAWSEVMNTGGSVGHGAVLPKREFLFVSDALAQLAANRMAAFVVQEFGR